MKTSFTFFFYVTLAGGQTHRAESSNELAVTVPPKSLKLDRFYRKYLDFHDNPIVSSAKVTDKALQEAYRIVGIMCSKRPDIVKEMARHKVRLAVMAPNEMTTDIPEHSNLKPKKHWDRRARGLGATKARPAVSCGEENLLGYQADRYHGESILIHEFAHTMHELGARFLDRDFDKRLKTAYDDAMKKGLWKKTYAATNPNEYWAEGVQDWFDSNRTASPADGIHNEIHTREGLKEYDPALATLIATVYDETEWRYKYPKGGTTRKK